MGKIFQTLILFSFVLFLLTTTSALQTFPQNKESVLCHAVRVEGGISTAVNCNITISYSNGTKLAKWQPMENLQDRFCYNITAANSSTKGLYDYEVTCTNGVFNKTESYQYLINYGGVEPSSERNDTSGVTILIFFGLGILLFISLFFIRSIPIKITAGLFMFWFFIMGINAQFVSMQDEVINPTMENFFSFFLVVSYWLNYAFVFILFIVWFITIITSIGQSRKRKRESKYD